MKPYERAVARAVEKKSPRKKVAFGAGDGTPNGRKVFASLNNKKSEDFGPNLAKAFRGLKKKAGSVAPNVAIGGNRGEFRRRADSAKAAGSTPEREAAFAKKYNLSGKALDRALERMRREAGRQRVKSRQATKA